jgi:PAS domain S-box-containing protein
VWLAAPEGIFPEELAPDLGLILDSLPDGIYGVDTTGRTVLVNRAAARLLGYEPAELIGTVPHDVMHHSRPDGSGYPREECPLAVAAAAGQPYRTTADLFWRRDGTSFAVEYESQPLTRDGRLIGFVVTFRDITERRRNEDRIRELLHEQFAAARAEFQYAQLRDILAQAPAVICVSRGARHVIETVNEQCRELVGGRDVLGLTMREAFPDIEHRRLALMDRAFETGEPARATELAVMMETAEGAEQRYYNAVYQPLRDETGIVYGLMTHAVDVTREVQARQQLQAKTGELVLTNARLRLAAEALARSNAELDAFAYAASHDLRAPLRGIANLAQWIEEDLTGDAGLKGDTRDMLALLRSRMHRMEALIDGILEYSRAGRITSPPADLDTRQLVQAALELLHVPEHADISIDEQMPTIHAAALPLQRIFMNLIGNALKYTSSTAPRVWVTAEDDGAFVRFSVRDNGPGIPPEYHTRIWGIFQTLEARDKVEATGIGLSLVKKLVEAQGGRAWVESTPGQGATFYFLWPKTAAAPPANED